MSAQAAYSTDSRVQVFDAVRALAFVGDLSMGQPIDHSARAAWLAAQLAAALGLDAQLQTQAVYVSLLRWSGCTANAPEIAELMGDDVGGRQAMLAVGLPAHLSGLIRPAAQIHCEVAGDVARTLGLPTSIELALRRIFENLDGSGQPNALAGSEVPLEVQLVQVAADLEIHSRVHDLERALTGLAARAGRHYPAEWLPILRQNAADWLHTLEQDPARIDTPGLAMDLPAPTAPLELIADVIDLKLPWLTGYSRRVAEAARTCAARLGQPEAQCQRIHRAALIHGMGRAAVPNEIWNQPGPPGEAAMERLRLVPYWTARAARRIGSLAGEADIASYADERMDGSGFFRGASGDAIGIEGRVLAAATQWVMWQTDRPGRAVLSEEAATQRLRDEAQRGRFDAKVVSALTGGQAAALEPGPAGAGLLSLREVEVLRRISHGESNKEAARTLGISPSTVRAHLENIFRKLECTTRAAATLKALTIGLL